MDEFEQTPISPEKAYYEEACRCFAEVMKVDGVEFPSVDNAGNPDTVDRFLFVEHVKDAMAARAEIQIEAQAELRRLEALLPDELRRGTNVLWNMLPSLIVSTALVENEARGTIDPLSCPDAADIRDFCPALVQAARATGQTLSAKFNNYAFSVTPEMSPTEAENNYWKLAVERST